MTIAFVGLAGVPYLGRACDPRLAAEANLLSAKNDIIIINRYSSLKTPTLQGVQLANNVHVIEIIKRRKTGKFSSALLYVLSVLLEPLCLVHLRMRGKVSYLHLYTGHYIDFVLYWVISRIIGAKTVNDYVEYRTAKGERNLYDKINNYLCDFKGAHLWDKCISISNFLEEKVVAVKPKIPVIKVTPLCDFPLFDSIEEDVDITEQYILFCGSAAYFEVVKQIIDAYRASKIRESAKLLLILSGSDENIRRVHTYFEKAIIRHNLAYNQLIAYYKRAFALMIPLRDTIEDIARFPNKICEYTAASGLIVTTNYGEIKYYFKDGVNAVVANECSTESIAQKLDDVAGGKYDILRMKKNCYETGCANFSIEAYRKSLNDFLS